MKIIVNNQEHELESVAVSYDKVVELAGVSGKSRINYYRSADGNGTLQEGDVVRVRNGTTFTVLAL